MAGSYYVKTTVKALLDIASADTADDTLLDLLGGIANQHIDNVLKIHDEKIPLEGSNVLDDIKMAANFYTAALYNKRINNIPSADSWMQSYQQTIDGIKLERTVENSTYSVERFMGRGSGYHDHYNEAGFTGG